MQPVTACKHPLGLAINKAGTLALIVNRNDNSINVLTIYGKDARLVVTVPVGEQAASVAISPDSKRALAPSSPATGSPCWKKTARR